jgi:hypothetical protein
MSIAASHLNFSLKYIPQKINAKPGLIICFHCAGYPAANSTNIKSFLLFVNPESFIYCDIGISLQNISIATVLFVPYDIYTWISLLLSFVLLVSVPKVTLWRTMDLLWSILGQPPQFRKHGLLTVLCFSIIFLQQVYLSYFTSSVVKPFEKIYIDSNEELLRKSPYKILVIENKNLSTYASDFYLRYKDELSNYKIGISINDSNYEDHFLFSKDATHEKEDDRELTRLKKISLERGKGTTLFYRKFQMQYVIGAEAHESGVTCHMLKETWAVGRVWIWFQGHLTQPLNDFLRSIILSGIDIFWEKAYINHFDRETRRAAEKLKSIRQRDSSSFEAASMGTSLSSFLKLFVLLLGFDLLVFFAELSFSSRMHNWVNRLKLNFWYWKNIALKLLY